LIAQLTVHIVQICVGDVHGNTTRLRSLLAELEARLGPKAYAEAHLLFCGSGPCLGI
jgi:hypothetical protein